MSVIKLPLLFVGSKGEKKADDPETPGQHVGGEGLPFREHATTGYQRVSGTDPGHRTLVINIVNPYA